MTRPPFTEAQELFLKSAAGPTFHSNAVALQERLARAALSYYNAKRLGRGFADNAHTELMDAISAVERFKL